MKKFSFAAFWELLRAINTLRAYYTVLDMYGADVAIADYGNVYAECCADVDKWQAWDLV